MAVNVEKLQIVLYPDPCLRRKARPVEAVNDEIRAIAARMLQLMHEAPGVGLAAPQVGLDLRLFVANPTGEPPDDRVFINPVLSVSGRETAEEQEGCLSLPEIRADIRRPKVIAIDAIDLDGKPFQLTDDDFSARVWQHETDHLDGVLIIDRMSMMDRMVFKKVLREMEKSADKR